MWIAVINNIPELLGGGVWSGVMIYIGFKIGRKFS